MAYVHRVDVEYVATRGGLLDVRYIIPTALFTDELEKHYG